jgi:tetratricopeptide (TPR) repeat protein
MTTAELIGRDHPAGVLRAEIERAAESHGGLVLVTGEAGIGKTTLVTDAAEAARRAGALVLSGSCWDSAAAPGYWPWVQVIRSLRRQVGEAAGPEVLLGERRSADATPDDGFQIYDSVTSALVAATQRQPVVVVLDDLHWADPESVRLLEFVAQHTWFERLLLVGTYRDVEVEGTDHPLAPLMLPLLARATVLTLTGLDQAGVGELLARTTGVPAEDDLAAEVHRRTGGNPFFVEQTARLWRGQGGDNALTGVAPGVRDAVRRRLALLPAPVSALLTDAAVLGREFHRQVLAAAVAKPAAAVDRLLGEAVAARLVSALGDGRFAFAHDLVRETLYESLDEVEVPRRHAAVVRALGRSAALAERIFPADRARHGYLAGGELEPGVVVDLLTAAAEDARQRMASEEMIGHLSRALELVAADDPRRARISLDLGVQYYHRRRHADADAEFRTAAEVALGLPAPEQLIRVALTLWGYDEVGGTLRADLMRATHERLIGPPGDEPLDVLAQSVIVHVIAEARSHNDDDVLDHSLWTKHDTLWEPGHAAERQVLTDELIAVARRTGDIEKEMFASSLSWVAAIELGDPRYLDRLRAQVSLAERHAVLSMRAAAFLDQSIIAALHGRFAESDELLDRGFDILPPEEDIIFSYMGHQLRWSLLLSQGRFDELDELQQHSIEVKYPHPALLAGLTAAQRGDAETAARCLDELGEVPGPFAAMELRLRAHVAFLTRSPEACARARAGLAPLAGQWLVGVYGCDIGGPADYWRALVAVAESDVDSATTGFRAAIRSAESLGARPWVVEAKLGLAMVSPEREAAALRAAATEEAAALGMRHRAAARPASVPANEFRYTGEVWSLTMAGHTVHLPDAKGLRDLHVLLSSPGTEIPATRLLNPAGGEEVVAAATLSGDEMLDAEARTAYRRRLSTLDEQIDAAAAVGDDGKAARLDEEREALLAELRKAAGLGSRTRRLGDETERARKAVTARIRDTLRKLDDRHPPLAAHLRESVTTGTTCRYHPPTPTPWHL